MHIRGIKKHLLPELRKRDFGPDCTMLQQFPHGRVVNALISFFLHKEEIVKWRAITGMGIVVARMAQQDLESARVIMRRLMWTLNDESGGIGWGSPEAMGEIMTQNDPLALEYTHILLSYISPGGNFIEYQPLQRGVLWGIGRLPRTHMPRMKDVAGALKPFFSVDDAHLRGLALRAAGNLNLTVAKEWLSALEQDSAMFSFYHHPDIRTLSVGQMAAEVLETLESDGKNMVHS